MAVKKVLIVDDSALVRSLLKEILSEDAELQVVGVAKDAYEARAMIKDLNPDVLTLDVEMPKMNGITFLSNLMRLRPMPVVMISTLTHAGAPATLEALELGAVDFLPKPKQQGTAGLNEYRQVVIDKVKAAANSNPAASREKSATKPIADLSKGKRLKANYICAIGASTGGTEAIKDVLVSLPKNTPPIVITQHIPAAFSTSFAERVDKQSQIKVFEAENNQPIRAGCAYIAPGDKHLKVEKSSFGYVCKLDDGPLVNRHKPAVEVMFRSVLEVYGKNAQGIILTGMGADGAQALLEMREAGCETIAQDEASSVVWGMPGAAVKLDAACKVMPLKSIGRSILSAAYN